jgi:hypothetical protein
MLGFVVDGRTDPVLRHTSLAGNSGVRCRLQNLHDLAFLK